VRATPRAVHLIWLGSPVPARVELLRADLARHDPDVEVRVWLESDLTWLANRDLLERQRSLPARADIARYEILLRHGGLYLDADVRVHRSLAEVFEAADRTGLVVARQSRTIFTNACLAAKPGHPLLTDVVEGLEGSTRWTGRLTTPATSGPLYFTERLLAHLRAGGSAHELPQHAVFPWHADETPLPTELLPTTVLMSHEWATGTGWSWGGADVRPTTVVIPNRRSRRQRSGRHLRARASATPLSHRIIGAADRLLVAGRWSAGEQQPDLESSLSPTVAAASRWVAKDVARRLSGSAVLLDLHPPSPQPLLAAARSLDRPGRAIAVVDHAQDLGAAIRWRDPSIRCSVHIVRCDVGSKDLIESVESHGSALTPRALEPDAPAIGGVTPVEDLTVAALIDGIPRLDFVRVDAHRMTEEVSVAVGRMTAARRIARLVLAIDATAAVPGPVVDLISGLETAGLPVSLGPWLVEGRGRTWREQLRVAARPFLVVVG